MKYQHTVHELRKQGNKVTVHHYRYYETLRANGEITLTGPTHISVTPMGCNVYPRGGETMVHVETKDGRSFFKTAKCNPSDNYNRKLGVRIALGRIVKQMENEELTRRARIASDASFIY